MGPAREVLLGGSLFCDFKREAPVGRKNSGRYRFRSVQSYIRAGFELRVWNSTKERLKTGAIFFTGERTSWAGRVFRPTSVYDV
jgi:hypothetical protein